MLRANTVKYTCPVQSCCTWTHRPFTAAGLPTQRVNTGIVLRRERASRSTGTRQRVTRSVIHRGQYSLFRHSRWSFCRSRERAGSVSQARDSCVSLWGLVTSAEQSRDSWTGKSGKGYVCVSPSVGNQRRISAFYSR